VSFGSKSGSFGISCVQPFVGGFVCRGNGTSFGGGKVLPSRRTISETG